MRVEVKVEPPFCVLKNKLQKENTEGIIIDKLTD